MEIKIKVAKAAIRKSLGFAWLTYFFIADFMTKTPYSMCISLSDTCKLNQSLNKSNVLAYGSLPPFRIVEIA